MTGCLNDAVEKSTKAVEKSIPVEEESTAATKSKTKATNEAADAEREAAKKAWEAEKLFQKNIEAQLNSARKKESMAKQEWDALSRSSLMSETLSSRFESLAGDSTVTIASLKLLTGAVSAAQKSITEYTGAIYKGERGAIVAAKSISTFANTLSETIGNVVSVLSFFLPGGFLVKGLGMIIGQVIPKLVEGATKYNELASEQADTLYKSFMELSKGGVNLTGGLTETFETMQQFGMSVSEATQFTSMLAGSAKDLKFLGATAGKAAKTFADVAGTLYKSDMGRQLELMGITAEEQRESALKFMSIQARTGQIQTKNTELLQKSAAAFTKEMDLAAELAGNTRKEQIEAREEAMTDERFNSAMREAVETGDKDREEELKKAQAMAAYFKSIGDEQARIGVLQLAAARGALTTEAAVKTEMQYGVSNSLFDRTKSEKDLPDIMQRAADYSRMQDQSLRGVTNLIGKTEIQTSGQGSANVQDRTAAINAGFAEARKNGFKGDFRAYLEEEQKKRGVSDDKTVAQTELRRTQQNTAMMMDSFVNSFIDVSKINELAAKTFSAAVDKFGAATGSKVAGGSLSTTTPKFLSTTKTNSNVAPGQFDTNAAGAAFGNPNISRSAAKSKASSSSASSIPGEPASGNSVTSSADALSLLSFGNESGTRESFLQLDSDIQQKVLAAAVDYNQQTGNKLRINSAMRSFEKQQELYDAYISGKSKFPAAKPGTSLHESGRAIDIEQGKNDAVAIASLIKQGLSQPIKNDPVHFQARTGGIFRGPSTGYNVELHGDEMVIPANDGVSKQALNTSVFNQDTSMIGDLMDMFQTMQYKYDQMIDLLSRQADNGDKLVQAAY